MMSIKKRRLGDYEVGYCKPPVKNQFKPGHSGYTPEQRERNKAASGGLPAGLSPWQIAILQAGDGPARKATARGRRATGIEAVAREILASAVGGDMRAAKTFSEAYTAADAARQRLAAVAESGANQIPKALVFEFADFMREKKRLELGGHARGEEEAVAAGGSGGPLETAPLAPEPHPPLPEADPVEEWLPEEEDMPPAPGAVDTPRAEAPAFPDPLAPPRGVDSGPTDSPLAAPLGAELNWPQPALHRGGREPLIRQNQPPVLDGFGLGGGKRPAPSRGIFT